MKHNKGTVHLKVGLRSDPENYGENGDKISESEADETDDSVDDYNEKKGSKRSSEDHTLASLPSKRSKNEQSELNKAPTAEELAQLRETENLYNSSLFRLQIDELLSEVLLKEKKRQKIAGYVQKLSQFLLALPEGNKYQLADKTWQKQLKVNIPLVQRPPVKKGTFQFIPPKAVHTIGSFLMQTCVKPDIHVDLAVEIPKVVFEEKDYLNERFTRKRAFYLAFLASRLLTSDLVSEVLYSYHHGNSMLPILVVKPSGEHGKNFHIKLHVAVETGTFKFNRFHVSKGNLRKQWYLSKKHSKDADVEEEQLTTPHYNSTVLHDLTLLDNTLAAHSAISGVDGIKKGLALLKVWVYQRGLGQGYGNASSYIITMFVIYLLSKRKLNRTMSSYQVVRNTFLSLSESDWATTGISLATQSVQDADPNMPNLVDFQAAFDLVFIDHTGYFNLCAFISRATYDRLRHEAKISLGLLSSPGLDGFDALFMTSVPFSLKFDQTFHIGDLGNLKDVIKKLNLGNQLMDHHGDTIATAVPHILTMLRKALGNRVQLINVKPSQPHQWSPTEKPPDGGLSTDFITFGLLVDIDHANSVLDKGPSADSPEAKEFREFWGEKSELRRFQDGSICEAVVWPSKTLAERRMVTSHIVIYTLEKQASIPRKSIAFRSKQLDCLLTLPAPTKRHRAVPYGTGEEQHAEAIRVFESLAKELRALKELPLDITSVQGTSPLFRFAEVFPARPSYEASTAIKAGSRLLPSSKAPCPSHTPALEVLCVLEGSGKWPEDLKAVQRLKAAFYIQFGKDISKHCKVTTSLYADHILVVKEGYVFKILLAYMREIALTKMLHTPDGLLKMADNEQSLMLEKQYQSLPRLTSTLHGLHQQYNSFSGSVRLAKRWLAAQLLLGDAHFPVEAVEILTAYLYIHPDPYTPPSTPLVGFLRFLHLLSSHDWQNFPLIVNLNEEFTSEDFTAIHNKFTEDRSELPLMFIATPTDRNSSHWTRHAPSNIILQRVAVLGLECLQKLTSQLEDITSGSDYKSVFRPSLEVYDVVIHIQPSYLARSYQAVDIHDKTLPVPCVNPQEDKSERQMLPVVEFDPVQCYLGELRDTYGDQALFFHDMYGGNVVGVLWKPSTKQACEFKPSNIAGRTVDVNASETQLVPNWAAILEDFKVLGSGIVKMIEVRNPRM